MKSLDDILEELPLHRQLKIAKEALSEMGKLQDWQPIESAPKDGTVIIGYDEFYHNIHTCEFCYGTFNIVNGNDDISLTHWQPLPAAPIKTGEKS